MPTLDELQHMYLELVLKTRDLYNIAMKCAESLRLNKTDDYNQYEKQHKELFVKYVAFDIKYVQSLRQYYEDFYSEDSIAIQSSILLQFKNEIDNSLKIAIFETDISYESIEKYFKMLHYLFSATLQDAYNTTIQTKYSGEATELIKSVKS